MEYFGYVFQRLIPLSQYPFLPTRKVEDLLESPVVVIGCDSGMGKMLLEELLEMKLQKVYAGCFSEHSVALYQSYPNCVPFQIDVTNEKSVEDAFRFIS